MELAKKAANSGRLPLQAFDALRTRFNAVHAWAMEHLGDEKLRSAVQALDPKAYAPPRIDSLDGRLAPAAPKKTSPATRPYLFPEDGDWRFTQKVRSSAVAKVDAIRDQALSLGWREAQLYQNRGRFRFPLETMTRTVPGGGPGSFFGGLCGEELYTKKALERNAYAKLPQGTVLISAGSANDEILEIDVDPKLCGNHPHCGI